MIVGRRPVARIHSPIQVSLRPPPYASAVSNVVMPRSHAASMSAKASSRDSPPPKNSGALPMPPKLPQPRTMRDTSTSDRPSRRPSMWGESTLRRVLVPLVTAAACAASPPLPPPRADRPRYSLTVRVVPGFRRVTGRVRVRFTASRPTDRLVFRLWPNGPLQRAVGQRLGVGAGTVDRRRPRTDRPDPTTLVVHLRRRLETGGAVTAEVPWTLRVPVRSRDRIARFDRGLRLGSFFPILAWDPARGWVTDPPARILGESSTSPTADFDVRVRAPAGTRVFASGDPAGHGLWHARAVRDVAGAVGRFDVAAGIAHAPKPVTVRGAVPPAAAITTATALRLARSSIERLSRLYGAYPWRTYTVVFPPDLRRE